MDNVPLMADFDTGHVLEKSFTIRLHGNKKLGDKLDVTLCILKLIFGLPTDVQQACHMVCAFTRSDLAEFGRRLGFKYLIGAAKKYKHHPGVCKPACLAIQYWWVREPPMLRGLHGVVELALRAAEHFSWAYRTYDNTSQDIRDELACTAQAALLLLRVATTFNTPNKEKCVAKGGVRTLFDVFATFANCKPAFLVPVCLVLNGIVKGHLDEDICNAFGPVVAKLVSKCEKVSKYNKAQNILCLQLTKLGGLMKP
jgi:hypothetical protein